LRILVDECLPEDLVGWLRESDVKTVQQVGWADKNLRYQQNLKGCRVAILVLPSNRLKVLRQIIAEIHTAIARFVPGVPGQYAELPQPPE
jgi:hypothetical protein